MKSLILHHSDSPLFFCPSTTTIIGMWSFNKQGWRWKIADILRFQKIHQKNSLKTSNLLKPSGINNFFHSTLQPLIFVAFHESPFSIIKGRSKWVVIILLSVLFIFTSHPLRQRFLLLLFLLKMMRKVPAHEQLRAFVEKRRNRMIFRWLIACSPTYHASQSGSQDTGVRSMKSMYFHDLLYVFDFVPDDNCNGTERWLYSWLQQPSLPPSNYL